MKTMKIFARLAWCNFRMISEVLLCWAVLILAADGLFGPVPSLWDRLVPEVIMHAQALLIALGVGVTLPIPWQAVSGRADE